MYVFASVNLCWGSGVMCEQGTGLRLTKGAGPWTKLEPKKKMDARKKNANLLSQVDQGTFSWTCLPN